MSAEPRPPRNIFLIGYRATGKTTVARLVAQALGWQWCDADELLEQQAGRSIRQIFAEEGEAGFRLRESHLLAELCRRQRHVIATGGGVVMAEAHRQWLRDAGWVVWLKADVDTICRRLSADVTTAERRPRLTVGGRAEVEELLRIREPVYQSCADFQVDTVGQTPAEVAETILTHACLRET